MSRRGVDAKVAMDAGGWKSSRIYLETYVKTNDAGRSVVRLFDEEQPARLREVK